MVGCANELDESTTSDSAAFTTNAPQLSALETQLVAEGEFCAGEACAIKLTLSMDGSTKKYSYTNGTKTDEGQWHANISDGVTTVNLVEVASDGRRIRLFAVKESQCAPNGPRVPSLQIYYQTTVLQPTTQGACELLE